MGSTTQGTTTELTLEQKRAFYRDGLLVLKGVVPRELTFEARRRAPERGDVSRMTEQRSPESSGASVPIGPKDGPVAVTGSGGYIGSHIVLNLVRHGYEVRACVRDATKLTNTAHLTAMNHLGAGSVTLHSCDMTIPGAYDEVFKGCVGVFHAAAEMGNLEGSTPTMVYEGSLHATRLVMDSVIKAGSVKRLVYTSSFAAVGHPAESGYVYTEDS